MTSHQTVRMAVEVVAGLLPGRDPEPEFTKRWYLTSEDWNAEGADQSFLLSTVTGQAQGYAMLLMLQPSRFNWVRTDWIWY